MLNPTAWVLVAAALLLMLGSRRLPDASRAVGRSLRILKGELRGLSENDVRVKAPAQVGRGPLGGRAARRGTSAGDDEKRAQL
jgi:sec-independent protein translocase protein TatA